jgi:hypothetical protein
MDRVAELKARVDDLKAKCREAQDTLTLIKGTADPSGRNNYWKRFHAAKKHWNDCVRQLQEAKTDLVRATGTTGSDPRWHLIAEAWRLLQRLEDHGVDLGEDGRKLLDEIEFHIPTSKLTGDST